MANPLTYKGNGIVQVMTTGEVHNFANAVLESFATINGPGSIYTSNVGNTGFTLIGTFTDTTYDGNVGDPAITILSTEYNLYQDVQTPTGDEPPRPLQYTSNTSPIQKMTNTQINTLADTILSHLVNSDGPGSYRLQSSAPVDGGTWANLGQLKDVFSGATESNKYLYKKVASAAYTVTRPLKYVDTGILQSYSNDDIGLIVKKVRERIVDTGVGQYKFQASTPVVGTWTNVGSIIDTRPDTSGTNYSTDYESTYTGSESYTGEAEVAYDAVVEYTGPVAYDSAADYTGSQGYQRTSYFVGSSSFAGVVYYDADNMFVDMSSYLGPGAGWAFWTFEVPNAQVFSGPAKYYTGPIYFSGPPGSYTNDITFMSVSPIENPYGFVGPVPPVYRPTGYTYTQFFTGITYYAGPGTFVGPSPGYVGPKGTFTGSIAYVGPANALSFAGSKTFSSNAVVYEPTAFNYGATTTYTPNLIGYYISNQVFSGTAKYLSPVAGDFGGPIPYTGPRFDSYMGPGTPTPDYIYYAVINGAYDSLTPYAQVSFFTGPTYRQSYDYFTGPTYFTGLQTFTGESTFLGGGTYTGTVVQGPYTLDITYDGPLNAVNYTVDTIGSGSQQITEIILWRRVG